MKHALPLVALLAIVALGGCTHKTGSALAGGKPTDYWVKNVASPEKKLRKEAVAKLGNVGGSDPQVLPALRTALHDDDAQVRGEAVLALAKLGAAAKPAAADLEELARSDPDAKVRDYASLRWKSSASRYRAARTSLTTTAIANAINVPVPAAPPYW